jgi:hypothetical protein
MAALSGVGTKAHRRVGRRGVLLRLVVLLVLVPSLQFFHGTASSAAGDPVIAAAGDIACDPGVSWFNGGNGTPTDCQQKATASLLTGADAVLPLGDNQYNCGGASTWAQSYDPSWGQQKAITHPVPGNHEYLTSGGTDCSTAPDAKGYFQYFGSAAGDPTKGYYSYDLGSWHIIAMNSECGYVASLGSCQLGSPEETWLRNDLAAHSAAPCTMAYWHRPRYVSTTSGGDSSFSQFWKDLYAAHADVILTGHAHWYERFVLQNPSGVPDENGIREFVVGTGGEESGSAPASTKLPTSAVTGAGIFGVLKMTLHAGSYDWNYVQTPSANTFTDSGSTACHNAAVVVPDTSAPTTTMTCNGSPCGTSPYPAPVTVGLSATDTGGSGVARTAYTTDGTDPRSSPSAVTYAGPFSVSQKTTVTFASVDGAGNQEAPTAQVVDVTTATDTTAPTTTITCLGTACTTGWYRQTTVGVTLSATDTGGSGVKQTRYTTDGTSAASSASAQLYTAPFAVAETTTVSYLSEDNAGNVEAENRRIIRIDAAPPSAVITSPANGSSYKRGSTIAITVTASDTGTGAGPASGVSSVAFYRDGSTLLSTDSSAPYSYAWSPSRSLSGSHTITAVVTDVAGNSTTSASVTVNLAH